MADHNRVAVTTEEVDKFFSGPAPMANRFIATFHPSGVRLAFAEQIVSGGDSFFRTAILLNYSDAISLYKLLQEMLQPIEADSNKKSPSTEAANG